MYQLEEIIKFLQPAVPWVNWNQTTDQMLISNNKRTVSKVYVTWTATKSVILQAIDNDVDIIISHENPFYLESTSLPIKIKEMRNEKIALLEENNIAVYRCHDLWDLYPEFGVRDQWSDILPFDFNTCETYRFHSYTDYISTDIKEVEEILLSELGKYHEEGFIIIGDRDRKVTKIGMGTGAMTNIPEMIRNDVDLAIVTDDGINNWTDIQLAMDSEISVIVVNHATSEIKGIKKLSSILSDRFPDIEIDFVNNTYKIHHIN